VGEGEKGRRGEGKRGRKLNKDYVNGSDITTATAPTAADQFYECSLTAQNPD
jgi:hypothetical protein